MNANNRKRILVFGCGWLGKKLAQHLISEGYSVWGTTRSQNKADELGKLGIQAIVLDLSTQKLIDVELPDVSKVVIGIAPGRKEGRKDYPDIIDKIATAYPQSTVQLIMYSSTSVYGDKTGEVVERTITPDSKSEHIIVSAEGMLMQSKPEATILRLCGLFGADRHPVHYLAGRQDLPNGDGPVNLVHSDQVIEVTRYMLDNDVRGQVFNVCSSHHPSRKNYYENKAESLGLEKPIFDKGGHSAKLIVSEKVIQATGINLSTLPE